MSNKYNESKFKQWLDILQQESWQLELIISGVAIFGLFQASEPVLVMFARFQALAISSVLIKTVFSLGFLAVVASLFSLTLCLLLHIILRGLWIGAVGLRYFSGDIDYSSLKYTDKFSDYLKKRIGSFDDYIGKLEDYCSIIFAISFLLVFFFISFFLSLGLFIIFFFGLNALIEGSFLKSILTLIFLILLSITYLFTAIDFFTQGFFKKKKWLNWIYFPIYRFMSRITLSFLYRPLLYNLLDNKLGKRILALLIPLFICVVILTGVDITESNYHSSDWNDKAVYANSFNYKDEIDNKEFKFVSSATIPSKIQNEVSLPVFIKHTIGIEDAIYHIDSTLVPEKDLRGLNFFDGKGIQINFGETEEDITEEEFDRYSKLLEEVITLTIDDTLSFNTPYVYSKNSESQIGYETVLDLNQLSRGLHTLHVEHLRVRNDSLQTTSISKIPFWYYPD